MKSMYSLIQCYPIRTKFVTLTNNYIVTINKGQTLKREQTACYFTYNVVDLFFKCQELNYLLGLNKRRYF